MRWEERLLAVFEDLEQQAEGLALAERDGEVRELGRAEYARVDLAARLHASVGCRLTLSIRGSAPLAGLLVRVGRDWCLLRSGAQDWVVALPAVVAVRGVAGRAVAEEARPVTARLGLGSALRTLGEHGQAVMLRTVDGVTWAGRLGRVGSDFVEVLGGAPEPREVGAGAPVLVPFGSIAAVGSG